HLGVGAGELAAAAANDVVEAHIVFERVRSNDVVVVLVDHTNDDSSRLIDASSDGLESHRHNDVSRRYAVVNADGKARIGAIRAGLGQNLVRWHAIVLHHLPGDGSTAPG